MDIIEVEIILKDGTKVIFDMPVYAPQYYLPAIDLWVRGYWESQKTWVLVRWDGKFWWEVENQGNPIDIILWYKEPQVIYKDA